MKISCKQVAKWVIVAIAIVVVFILSCYFIVTINAMGKTFDNVTEIPDNEVGLLLGTSPITPGGARNHYFDNRVKATADLYHAGKISRIIASGGDYSYRSNGCNELVAMRDSLVARGVPDSVISLDYNGLRTVNSIANAKKVYGVNKMTIISQEYHNDRAIWLAEHFGIEAVAYNAKPSHITSVRLKNSLREYLARVKMFIDIVRGDNQEE